MPRLKHRIPVMLVLIALAVLISAGWSQTGARSDAGNAEPIYTAAKQVFPAPGIDDFMKKKMAALNEAMGAAAKDEFQAVEKAGVELIKLSKDAAWNLRANEEYLRDTSDFLEAARFMIRMAESEDALGVASSYAAVSTCCLNCHRHVRSPKIAGRLERRSVSLTGDILEEDQNVTRW